MTDPQQQLAADATTEEMADAIAAATERRNRKLTVREQILTETRKLLAIKVDHNGHTVS